jgi:phosphatidate cytidylyltransferase
MKRIATAAVLIPLISYVVLYSPQWAFLAVTAVIALFCFHEYAAIVAGHGIQRPGPVSFAAGLLLLVLPKADWLLVVLLSLLTLTLMLRSADLAKGLPGAAGAVLGIVYVFGAWRTAVALRSLPVAGAYWLFFALVLNWIGDTAAFYVGSAIGRHKMASRLSPAKSWEGSAASFVASLVFGFFYIGWLMPAVPPVERLALAALGNIAGQLGDLVESFMKRGAGVKDSGTLLPGHGGWLDRVDSSLFSMPAVYALLIFLGRN